MEDIIEYSNNVTNLIEGYSLETLVADLDTLCSWLGMYEEARYVASLDSDEPELKEFSAQYNESIRRGFGLKETKERNI